MLNDYVQPIACVFSCVKTLSDQILPFKNRAMFDLMVKFIELRRVKSHSGIKTH